MSTPDTEADTDPMGPLSKLLLDGSDVIDSVIATYGPSAVAEFFTNTGTMIAAAYGLAATGSQSDNPDMFTKESQ